MSLRATAPEEFYAIQQFYWGLIDLMQGQNASIGWKKGIYPTDEFLRDSIRKGEMYILETEGKRTACVILNSQWNEGYDGLPWKIDCGRDDILVPHALAVWPGEQGKGVGKAVVADILALAREKEKKTVRLDILGTNTTAERLYTRMGFEFVAAKTMFYEDTGWTEYKMYELVL